MGRPKGFDRNETLDRAIQLFWRKGFADTSLQDLEAATGVNKSGLYSEFKDKSDIFTESVKRYASTNGVLEILAQEPRGRGNLERFILSGQVCKGQRGCFLANSIREMAILPGKAKQQITEHVGSVRKAVIENLRACNIKGDPDELADILLTYNSGLALRTNMGEIKNARDQVQSFLDKILK